MNFKPYIFNEYRQTAPDIENDVVGAGVSDPEPAVLEAEPEAITPDTGVDTIPEADNLWDSLSREIEDDDDSEDSTIGNDSAEPEPEVIPPPTPADPEPTPEAVTPAEVPEVVPEIPVETPPDEQPAAVTPEPEPEPQPQQTAQDFAAAEHAERSRLETSLQSHFAISDDEALQLVTNPATEFPKLQARMFTDMWMAVQKSINNQMPQVIERTTQEMTVRNEKVDNFFKTWPKLDRVKHAKQVAEVSKVFGQVNTGATEEEVIRHVGMQVMLMNGFTPDMTPVGDVAPVAPLRSVPVTPTTPSPAPYSPSAVNGVSPQLSADNIWSAMAEELLDDD